MTLGFTISSQKGLSNALQLGNNFVANFKAATFVVISVGEVLPSPKDEQYASSAVSLLSWSELSIDSEFYSHWPFIFTQDRVVGLLIANFLDKSLHDHDEVFYINEQSSSDDLLSLTSVLQNNFRVLGTEDLKSASFNNYANFTSAIFANKRAHNYVTKWVQQLEDQTYSESFNFTPSFFEFITTLSVSCDVGVISRGLGEQSWASGNVWSQTRNGLTIRSSLRRTALQELLNGYIDLPDPFSKDDQDKFHEWGMNISPTSVSALPRFLDAAVRENPDVYREFVLFDFTQPKQAKKWWKSKKKLLIPEIKLFETNHLVEKTSHLEMVDSAVRKTGVDLFGYLSSGAGVGQATRLISETLRSSNIDVSEISLPRPRSIRVASEQKRFEASHDIAIMCVDAFQFVQQRKDIGESFFANRYTIAQWYWELEEVPDYYREPLSVIDEFWAPTRFLGDAMASIAPPTLRITHMPLPIPSLTQVQPLSKQSIGLDDQFLFYFAFDFLSVVKRKNPQAIVRAFNDAFGESDGAALLIKSVNGVQRPRELNELKNLVHGRRDIKMVDEFLPPHLNRALMATADCYVSLHRSEGYGLTLAEAMSMGKPVIATGYSGNTDFMTGMNSMLIPYSLVKVGVNAEGYPAESSWAEPDHAQAVLAMQKLVDDRSFAENLGQSAEQHIKDNFSQSIIAEKMSQRIRNIQSDRAK
jgi:glycosyltransferase involved in cell wall biosynthesis